jgi:hypothetical protein
MKWWINILETVKEAIEEAEHKLRVYIEKEEQEKIKQMARLSEMIHPSSWDMARWIFNNK